MKKHVHILLAAVLFLLSGCKEENEKNVIEFAVCADYPPFEYYENGKIVGFDIELAELIAKKLGKRAVFRDMQFLAIIVSVKNEMVDAAISALAVTKKREESCDFSEEYYSESFATVYKRDNPVTRSQLAEVKIVCQSGSTMEIWLRKNVPHVSLTTVDNNNQAIESLKAGHVDCVFMDEIQASTFCKKNPGLAYSPIAESGDGYAIAMKKGAHLKEKINDSLRKLTSEGEVEKLKRKWLTE
ncbi:MAG: ABC transporter substrate-binding protein [Holosporales bacterium]|jgi:polar amino acid transport system substrate-binding protein|nr:ABC transporter substrate-binding protein [Holosporales bacterium]